MVGADQFYFNVRNMSGSETSGKMNYISREDPDIGREEVPVYNRAGRPMSDREKEQFIEKAERHGYCQRWQLSPPNGMDLEPEDVRRETKRVAHDYTRDKRSSKVAYAVHPGEDGRTHAHVLIAGEESELRMQRDDINQTRENAHQRMTANERYRERQREREQKRRREQQRQREQERERGNERVR